MIHDGYGEQHREYDEYEEVIREKERLLQIQVSERNRDAAIREDLIQEARITLWRVLERKPDAAPAYLHASTAQRLTELVTRGYQWFGMTGRQGLERDPLRRVDRDSFDDPGFLVQATAPEVLDSILMGYHEGEILDVIRALPRAHQVYVILRFWGGWTHNELRTVLMMNSMRMHAMWGEDIQPVLAERLAYLVEA
jgi:DNA-directed RNA polymerase specialized sigma24 family protein